jgi:hypothetical protein
MNFKIEEINPMLRSAKSLNGYLLATQDGEIGRCNDFLFDDEYWIIRYMVADTRKWLPGQKVLISPAALGSPDWSTRRFPVNLSSEQIKKSPPLDEDAPVSRLYEIKYADYYSYSYYWAEPRPTLYPPEIHVPPPAKQVKEDIHPEESHLRSIKEVTDYRIRATDGDLGYAEDFIIEEEQWIIRYLVIDTRKWLPGRSVLVSPGWIEEVDWMDTRLGVNLSKNAIKNGPEYDPSEPINREYEARLYDYYGRPHYWK